MARTKQSTYSHGGWLRRKQTRREVRGAHGEMQLQWHGSRGAADGVMLGLHGAGDVPLVLEDEVSGDGQQAEKRSGRHVILGAGDLALPHGLLYQGHGRSVVTDVVLQGVEVSTWVTTILTVYQWSAGAMLTSTGVTSSK